MEMKHGPFYLFPSVDDELPITIALIGINYCNPNYINIRKNSWITVIGYVLSGQGNVTIDDKTYSPKKGDVFILPAGRNHQVAADPENEESWSYIWFNISGDLPLQLLESYKLLGIGLVSESSVERLFQKAIQLAQSVSGLEMLNELPIIFHQILIRLSDITNKKNIYSAKVQGIKRYLDHQILHAFDSNHFCKHIGLSFKQINRLFKKELDTTVYNYVLIKKLDSAKMMLLDTELTINEICYRLGYADPHYFSNLFKKKTGMSPSNYRIQNRDDKNFIP